MIKKQKKLIIIGAVAFAVLAAVYFIFLAPLLKAGGSEDEAPELLDGEVLGTSNRILMMEHIEKADIERIEVHNSNGGYTFYRDGDSFYLENYEDAPYGLDKLSSVVVASGYTLSMKRLMTDCDSFGDYGLGEEDDPAYYIITKLDGTSHKVWIGDPIITGAGYYCRYDGRDALYILDSSISVLLSSVYDLITPILSYPLSTSAYAEIDDFYIIRDGEFLIWLDYLTPEEIEDTASLGDYRFKYPAQYTPNLSAYSSILEAITSFSGEKVVELGAEDNVIDEKLLLEKYNINIESPAYEFHFTYKGAENFVVFSPADEYGYMYAYSSLFNLVATINISSANFLTWDLIKFVDRPVFQMNINEIARIEIESDSVNVVFLLDGEGEDIRIKPENAGRYYDASEVKNFRQFYKTLLSVYLEDYSDTTDISNLSCMATVRVTTDAGIVTEYKYYPYNTRRAFFTINGEGEFYTLRKEVEKLLNDAQRILDGEAVNSDDKS